MKHSRCFKIYVFCCDIDFVIISVYGFIRYKAEIIVILFIAKLKFYSLDLLEPFGKLAPYYNKSMNSLTFLHKKTQKFSQGSH